MAQMAGHHQICGAGFGAKSITRRFAFAFFLSFSFWLVCFPIFCRNPCVASVWVTLSSSSPSSSCFGGGCVHELLKLLPQLFISVSLTARPPITVHPSLPLFRPSTFTPYERYHVFHFSLNSRNRHPSPALFVLLTHAYRHYSVFRSVSLYSVLCLFCLMLLSFNVSPSQLGNNLSLSLSV
ncbi:hypothetical protein B0F90DRAFT_869598 [Multifurca ochricompacta]|uniref:Transmembrane protein n=1 Tax=Multifurca ochricompacta TaxID=376703 RepID=A0AAD4M2Z2_9AGAM|nr:hypothetical protein B0F90DRAFT_869598 [Multifurca ochricompacta]